MAGKTSAVLLDPPPRLDPQATGTWHLAHKENETEKFKIRAAAVVQVGRCT